MANVKKTRRKNPNIQVNIERKRPISSKSRTKGQHKKTSDSTRSPPKTIQKKRQKPSSSDPYHDFDDGGRGTLYRYTKSQTRTWKPLGKAMCKHLTNLLYKNQELVLCKKLFQGDEAVSDHLQSLTSRLIAKFQQLRVPQKKYGDYSKVKDTLAQLKEELADLTEQELQLEKAAKKEKKLIDHISNMAEMEKGVDVRLNVEVPEDVLNIPPIEFH